MTAFTNPVTKQFFNFTAKGSQSTVTKPAFFNKERCMLLMVEDHSASGVIVGLGEINISFDASKRKSN
jgi:hypothetical protein